MSELKNVMIIGLGYAGLEAANTLAKSLPPDYRIVALQEQPFVFNLIASLRAGTVPGWENKSTTSVDKVFSEGSRHVVLGGAKVVKLGAKSLKLEKVLEGWGSEIEFEYAVIATGAAHGRFQEDLQASDSILVLGGGASGVEYAAEVASQYTEKKVTLVHSRGRLFEPKEFVEKLGPSLASQLGKKGVKIVYNARTDVGALQTGKVEKQSFELSDGTVAEADFVFLAHGWKARSDIVASLDPSLVNDSGFVKVQPTLQLASPSYGHIFAAGDVNDVPELKRAGYALRQGSFAAANILALIKRAGQVGGWFMGWRWLARIAFSKTLGVSRWFAMYNQPARA
ncbi:hypothetical protein BCR35DRAFT_330836 [Leucosporidium creatinivorum]|uniref:FAD/NAD(P)-binding domain-containing protein n=1 Tax=Leucosporidium creatinivorum TaxID=106004 RepID=A0A1Y2FMY0_9BASI|nr:hypothetical protein BCR35DRAFT_330836 [Leucosporidium creatinivorum]